MNIYGDYEVGRPEPTTLTILNEREDELRLRRIERYNLLKQRAATISDFRIERSLKMKIIAGIDERIKVLDESIKNIEGYIANFKSRAMSMILNGDDD